MSGVPIPAWLAALLGTLGIAGGGWLFASSFTRLRLRRKVADTPTSPIRSVAMGPAELKGLAAALQAPQVGPFSGQACCWWRITVDQEDVTQTKNGTQREWREIHASRSEAPFALVESGVSLPVLPAGAEIDCPRLLEVVTGGGLFSLFGGGAGWLSRIGGGTASDDALAGLPGPQTVMWAASGPFAPRRRLREWRIDLDRPLYVLGVVREGRPSEGPMLEAGRQGEPFLITTESEEEVLRRLGWSVAWRLLGGAAIVLAAFYLMLRALGA